MAKADDPRMRTLFEEVERKVVSIVAFPFDEGCVRNGGRPGAKSGPKVALEHIPKVGALRNCAIRDNDEPVDVTKHGLSGPHWIEGTTLEEAHEHLRDTVQKEVEDGKIPFVIGGGNDQSWFNADAVLRAKPGVKMGVINIDAHFDVRPLVDGKMHSGSPFRMLLESEAYKNGNVRFAEFAAQGQQCSLAHVEYLKEKGARIVWLDHMRRRRQVVEQEFRKVMNEHFHGCDFVFVSFDIDSIRQSDVPCVSCPSPVGLTAEEALDICRIAGEDCRVQLFDVSEFNPEVCSEWSYNTGRLVANMLYSFLLGRAIVDTVDVALP